MKSKTILAVVLTALALCAEAAPLKIGWAMNDISTDKPVALAGTMYRRVSKGLRDPLMATALVIDNGEDCVIFLSMDLIHSPESIVKWARILVRREIPDFPVEKILFNATHTHTGPNLYRQDKITKEYRQYIMKQVAKTIVEAWKNRKPGKIAYGYDLVVTAFNRRIVYFHKQKKGLPGGSPQGVAKLHGNTNTPDFSHVEGWADPFVNYLFTYDMEGNLTGAIMNVPYTSQVSIKDVHMSSDTWNDMRKLMAEKHPGIFILPQVAAAGEATFEQPYYKEAEKRRYRLIYGREEAYPGEFQRKQIAGRLLTSFERARAWAEKEQFSDLPIRHVTKKLMLSRYIPSEKECEIARADLEEIARLRKNPPQKDPAALKKYLSRLDSGEARSNRVLKMREDGLKDPKLPMEFHALRIGDVGFVSEQYEYYYEFGQRIAARSPFTQTFVIQLSAIVDGGSTGYLATERATKNGGYGVGPLSCRLSPQGGQEIVEAAVEELNKLKKDER
jgi:hypothetical protein